QQRRCDLSDAVANLPVGELAPCAVGAALREIDLLRPFLRPPVEGLGDGRRMFRQFLHAAQIGGAVGCRVGHRVEAAELHRPQRRAIPAPWFLRSVCHGSCRVSLTRLPALFCGSFGEPGRSTSSNPKLLSWTTIRSEYRSWGRGRQV